MTLLHPGKAVKISLSKEENKMTDPKCNVCKKDMTQSMTRSTRWICLKCNVYYEEEDKEYRSVNHE